MSLVQHHCVQFVGHCVSLSVFSVSTAFSSTSWHGQLLVYLSTPVDWNTVTVFCIFVVVGFFGGLFSCSGQPISFWLPSFTLRLCKLSLLKYYKFIAVG